jgi:1,4-alpha-glucan branching enzyme
MQFISAIHEVSMAAKIEFSLLAPYNEEVYLQGAFSDWQDVPMVKDKTGVWRCEVELEDGTHAYRFRLKSLSWFWDPGTWVELIDPWATQVDEAAKAGIATIQDGKRVVAPYTWQHDSTEQPDPWHTVAYEMHIAEFGGSDKGLGTFTTVTERLDYLLGLGVNTIQLMPVVEFPGDRSWGYNPAYPFATESAYGTPAEFKALVDACHGKGIRVITDMLFNHVTPDCPLTQIDHDYWFNREPTDPDFNWGPEFNYDKHDENYDRWPAWQFAGQVVDFWLQEYHIDGIRYDAVKQLNHPRFLGWITERAHEKSGPKPFFNIAEHIPDMPDIVCEGGPMDSCWHDSFCHTVRDYLCSNMDDQEALKNALDPRRRGYDSALQLINYLSNHDQPRLLNALTQAGLSVEAALDRYQMGVVILMTAIGLPMLRMGDEWGEARIRDDAGEVRPLKWQELETEPGISLFKLHQVLIALRKQHPALQQGDLQFIWEDARALAYLRCYGEDQVVIALNLRDEPIEGVSLPVAPGSWHRVLTDDRSEGQTLELTLAPWSAQIWLLDQLATTHDEPQAAEHAEPEAVAEPAEATA